MWKTRTTGWLGVALAAAGVLGPGTALAQKQIVRLVLDGPVLEAPQPDAEFALLFGRKEPKTLYSLVEVIREASEDRKVSGMALILEQPEITLAQIEELTRALRAFRGAGKKVYCYTDFAMNGSYALAAAADHVTLAENSTLWVHGLSTEVSFYKGLMDKIGVQVDVLHCGAYKAAGEPFTRTEPSKEFAENINWLLDGIYERWVELIAEGRGLTPEQVKAAVDAGPLDAGPALQHKLVDAVGSFPQFKQMLHKEFGKDVEVVKDYGKKKKFDLDFSNPFAIFDKLSKMFEPEPPERKAGIALIYIEGGITVGKSESGPFGVSSGAGSTTIRAALEKARNDPDVKAVVLRVDSPGGSAIASDIMWEAATRLGSEKPLVVSMGQVAGSGGYYVSIPGDTIFAEASTITGSIGVVGGKIIWNDLWEHKLGVTTTEFQRGTHAGLWSMNRPWTEAERAWVQNWMNGIYEQFKGRVMKSRGDRIRGTLEDSAGGRVYTGRQALERGLVDRIGGLADAIEYAARKVGLENYEVYVLPKPEDFQSLLARIMGQELEDEYEIGAPGARAALGWMRSATATVTEDPLLRALAPLVGELAPQQWRRLSFGIHNAMILHREHVGMFMPFDGRLR